MRFLLFWACKGRNSSPEKEKREQAPVIQMWFSTEVSISRNKEKSIGFFVFGERRDEVEQGVRTAQEFSELA
jgi:hypothetical protein